MPRSRVTHFCQDNILHTTIQPNTTDRSTAQTALTRAKQLLIRCKLEETDFETALADMRNEPTGTGPSARQIFMGAEQRKGRPKEDEQPKKAQEKDPTSNQDKLEVGDGVLVKHQQTGRWNKETEVVEQRDDKLSYVIKDDTGQILIRRRRLVKPKPPPLPRSYLVVTFADSYLRANIEFRNKACTRGKYYSCTSVYFMLSLFIYVYRHIYVHHVLAVALASLP